MKTIDRMLAFLLTLVLVQGLLPAGVLADNEPPASAVEGELLAQPAESEPPDSQSATYTVTLAADPVAGGTVTGGGTVNEGESTTVTATANEGYVFDAWCDGDGVKLSTDESYTFMPIGDITLTAKFVQTSLDSNVSVAITSDYDGGLSTYVKDSETGEIKEKATYIGDVKPTYIGDVVTYTIKVRSTGDDPAENTVVNVTPPDALSLVSGDFKTIIDSLAPNETTEIVLKFRIMKVPNDGINLTATAQCDGMQEAASATNTLKVKYSVITSVEPAEGGSITEPLLGVDGQQTITYAPNRGYRLAGLTLDGQALSVSDYPHNYTFAEITQDHFFTAKFAEAYDLTNVSVQQTGTLTYNGKPQTADVAASATAANDETVTFTYSAEQNGTFMAEVPAFTDAGTHTVYYKASAADHNDATGSFTVTIGKAPLTLGLSLEGWTEGEAAKAPVLTGNAGNGAVTYEYKLATADEAAYGTTVPTAAGEYTIRATVAETSNYLGGEKTASFVIDAIPPAPTTYSVTATAKPAEGGTVTGGGTVTEGESATVTATASEGYEFVGWYAGDDKASGEASYTFAVGADTALVARFTVTSPARPATHTVTFDANGHGTAPAAQEVEDGKTATRPADPEEAGWAFGGWYTEAACESEFDFDAPIDGDVTLYARWEKDEAPSPAKPATHTVTFDANGHGTAPAAQTVEDGKTATRPADPEESGWSFGGWYMEATCESEFDFATPIDGDVTLYAKWTSAQTSLPAPANMRTISYDLNGGTLDGKTGTVTVQAQEGSTITLPAPTREGYAFDYWKGSRYNAGDTYTVKGDHTFTAQWKKDGGSGNSTTNGSGGTTTRASGTSGGSGGTTTRASSGASAPARATPSTGDAGGPAPWLASLLGATLVLLGIRRRSPREGRQ